MWKESGWDIQKRNDRDRGGKGSDGQDWRISPDDVDSGAVGAVCGLGRGESEADGRWMDGRKRFLTLRGNL